jgi:FdhE protein
MNNWERRMERAAELSAQHPEAAELLDFYRLIAGFQKRIAEAKLPDEEIALDPARIPEPLRRFAPQLLGLLEEWAPAPLANVARRMKVTKDWDPADPSTRFVARVLVQPYAERLAGKGNEQWGIHRPQNTMVCGTCGERPVAAVLRPEGEGGKRSLLCSLCFREWDFGRLLCPNCGESQETQLPVFAAEQFAHVRIAACETCRYYIKTVDLTRDGLAVPEVDELAALALDLWANERGYTKLQANLFGL